MLTLRKHIVSLYVDQDSQQWVVRDPDGMFWIMPAADDPWQHREPFEPTEDMDLQPVPAHYKYLLNLPF